MILTDGGEIAIAPGLADIVEDTDEDVSNIGSLATPWPRYWARMLDVGIGVSILAFIAGLIFPAFFVGSGPNFNLFGLALIPFVMMLDAGVIPIFGNTLGKGVAGIRIETIFGTRPTFLMLLRRNLRCWIYGMGMGIPIISLVTMLDSRSKVEAGHRPRWDEDSETRVVKAGSNGTRTTITAIIYILLLAGLFYLETIKKSAHDELVVAIPQMNRDLPKVLDKATIFNRVSLDKSTIIFDYTLTNADGSTMSADSATAAAQRFSPLEATNRSQLCAHRTTNLLGRGISMRYRYSAKEGVAVEYTVSSRDCL